MPALTNEQIREMFKAQIEAEEKAVDEAKDENGEPIPKSRVKKMKVEIFKKYKKMAQEKAREDEEKAKAEEEARRLEESKTVIIEEDKSLPEAIPTKIKDISSNLGRRVSVCGWAHRIRWQGKGLLFIIVRDGTGYIQTVLSGKLPTCYNAITLAREACVKIVGEVHEDERAVGGYELRADYWELLGASDSKIEELVRPDSGADIKLNQRHIVLRGEKTSAILRVRSEVLYAFRKIFHKQGLSEVTPPTIVSTFCEGSGAELFKLDYYGRPAFMTQSSQLYLETCCPALRDVFCILPSYRAEKSRTRRHLAEFTHVEMEYSFITFDELLDILEATMQGVVERVKRTCGEQLKRLNPDLMDISAPFKRMRYSEAIEWLNAHPDEEDPKHYEWGMDIEEKNERRLVDTIGCPIFLTHFPPDLKSFYMSRPAGDDTTTESADLLLPGVGEVIGGSMRISDYDTLIKSMEEKGINGENYGWYLDMRRYGGYPHGGCGIGLDRFLCWLCGQDNIRKVVLYPRTADRINP